MTTTQPVVMPKLGLTMTEGLLAEWRVAVGDRVSAGEILFIVETDKIANEVEAAEAGIVTALHAAAGDVLPVGTLLATIAADGAVAQASFEPVIAPPLPLSPSDKRIIASPLARRRAAQAGIDLATVPGSGPRGRVMADDVAAVADSRPAATSSASPRGTVLPLGRYQEVAARRLTASKRDIPHFYVFAEADVTDLLDLRARLNAEAMRTKITVNHFLLAAVARALAAMPAMNRVWHEEGMLELATVDIGLAVESPKGLLAPVLHDLGRATLDDVAGAATQMVDAARAGRLPGTALEGGAITLSNVGMFGATGLLPIINPGQSSILGVGRNRPEYRPDAALQPCLRQILGLSLACDHRVIDGALAARFLQSIQIALEAPLGLLRRPLAGAE